jgi:archaellum biogenesis ATPase FlaH
VESLPVIDFMRNMRKIGGTWKILILRVHSNYLDDSSCLVTRDIAARSIALAV